jgi:microcystin-dependent protein
MVNINIKEGVDTLSSVNSIIPTGALVMKASAPSALSNYDTDAKCINAGYIPCDGRTLNATTFTLYQELFDTIGNIYGGTNNTNFKVPDLRTSRRYVYGQPTASSGVYTPSFSANTTNAVTHTHTVNGISGQNLTTNATAGSHSHSTISFTVATANHEHYHGFNYNVPGYTTGGGAGTTLTKSDGTGTAAGAAHTHTHNAINVASNTNTDADGHNHNFPTANIATGSYTEATHTHSIPSSNVTIPAPTAIDIPYVNMLYFIKL